ncbi:hypothetical protein K9L16_03600, partial [Candidatus Pacearchaeota archaeon]|nr:hypothetical protein [Candidatus Pacearchaeota archaeon]
MVYKKYIKRGGKIFGPYYYKSIKKDGKVITEYLGTSLNEFENKKKFSLTNFLLIFLTLFLFTLLLFFNFNYYQLTLNDFSNQKLDLGLYKVVTFNNIESKNIVFNSKLDFGKGFNVFTGFVSQKLNQTENIPQETEEIKEINKTQEESEVLIEEETNKTSDESINEFEIEVNNTLIEEEFNTTLNNSKDEINDTNNSVIEGNLSDAGEGINETFIENNTEINESNNGETVNKTFLEENSTSETEINHTQINETENQTEISNQIIPVVNETFNQTEIVKEENKTIFKENSLINTTRTNIVVNKPVKWIKKIQIENTSNFLVKIPRDSENISVKTGNEIQEAEDEIKKYNNLIKKIDRKEIKDNKITGFVSKDLDDNKYFLVKILDKFRKIFITGNLISEFELEEEQKIILKEDSKEINLSNINETEIAVEYYTPAPIKFEENTSKGKRIVISALSELNYTDILAYTELEEEYEDSKIKLYHIDNGKKNSVDFNFFDLNENGLVDYIEWNVSHLSNQTYELEIVIIDAEHLGSNRDFISNIYDYVNETDNVTYTIPEGDYARAYFENNLTSENWIDVFALNKNPGKIEVYEKDSDVVVGEINNVTTGVYYIDLNFSGSNSVFDLKSIGSNITYDYIHDESADENDTREIGYEYLNASEEVVPYSEADYVHIWNQYYDYYFNKSSGIQFTNHFNDFWARNIFCGGYKNSSNEWVYICNDEFPFTWSIDSDDSTYVNITGYRDLEISGRTARIAIRYHLKDIDENLTLEMAIRNIGSFDINTDLGFAWRVTDIKIGGHQENDTIIINNTQYWLNETLDVSYANQGFYEFYDEYTHEWQWLDWNENINHLLRVRNKTGEYNAPLDLGINIGTLAVGQTKSTTMYWLDGPADPANFDTSSPVASPNPVVAGENITFYANTTGTSYDYTLFICDGSGVTCDKKDTTTPPLYGACIGTSFCASSAVGATAQASCQHDTSGESGTVSYYAHTCNSNGDSASDVDNPNTYEIDTPPEVAIISPLNQNYSTSSIWFNISANDSTSGIDSCWYNLNHGNNITMSNSSDIYSH